MESIPLIITPKDYNHKKCINWRDRLRAVETIKTLLEITPYGVMQFQKFVFGSLEHFNLKKASALGFRREAFRQTS